MADIQSNINVNIDTSEALASIKVLQRQISAFYTSMARSGAAANAAVSNMQSNLINTINQTGKFSATVKTVTSSTEAFTNSLEKNKFSLGQYFRYAAGASKTFGKSFLTEMQTIDKVARERVKTLQTQYVSMGRDANGALKAIAIRPMTLDLKDLGTQTAIAAQKQQILNQLLKQGSTNLLNFGKNTQWAGRQLMVGFTIPLSMVGTAAAKTFMRMEEQAIKFKRVYGDSMTPTAETDAMIQQVRDLATEFTKYGVAAEKTMELAATAAAAGKQGADLTAQVREANRLAVLGQVEQQEALNTTISITNAFGTAAEDLAEKINFLNAVENQTVTSIEDLTVAVPKAGPVVQQLGGDVEDLTFFLTAMREGGINASEGANALKSGLASLINPTGKASEMLAGFGINVKEIVESNKGDVRGLVVDFASALDTLDPLNRARAIEQMFGKFQFSRLSTLFQNVIQDGSQASRVLDLTSQSSSQLASLASKELGTVAASSMFKFQKAVEELRMALAPVGEIFLKLVTPVIEFGAQVLENFNKLDSGAKNFILGIIAVVGGLGPVLLMTFGLLANGVANIIKGFMLVRKVFTGSAGDAKFLGDQTDYMTQQQLEAAGVAASLEQVHQRLEQRFTSEAGAVNLLTQALERAVRAQVAFQGTGGTARPAMPKKYAKGVVSVPGPKGAGDIVPAMLAPGEAVIPSKQAQKYAALIQGIVADNLPGYEFGNTKVKRSRPKDRPGSGPSGRKGKSGVTVQRPYGANSLASGGLVSFTDIDPSDLADLSNIYIQQIREKAGVSVAAINREVDQWTAENIEAIKLATEQVNAGVDPTVAFKDLTEKFATDMRANNGAVAKMNDTFEQMVPELQADLKEAQEYARQYNLNIKDSAEDAKRLADALPNNTVAQAQIKPGNYQNQAKARQALTAIQGGTSGIETKGFGRFMVLKNQPVQSPANMLAASQEHFSTTFEQMEQRVINQLARLEQKSQASFASVAKNASESVETIIQSAISETRLAVEKGLNLAIQRNSPPEEAIKIGKDYGFALNGALREMIPKAKVAGEAFGIAATTGMTTVTPAMRQHLQENAGRILRPYLDAQGRLIPIASQKIEILNREAIAAQKAATAQESFIQVLDRIAAKAASMPQSPLPIVPGDPRFIGPLRPGDPGFADRMQQETQVAPRVTGNLEKFSNTVRSTSFVMTSLAAAGTMSGGVIGEMSNKIMQFSGIIFVATTLMDIMVAAQQRHILAQMAHTKAVEAGTIAAGTQMKTGFLSAIGSFLMFSKGGAAKAAGGLGFLASMKNAFLPIANAFKTAGPGIKGFFGAIRTAVPALLALVRGALSFVPVIGWVVAGATALAIVIDQVNKANERARLETEGLGDASRITAKQINAVGEAFGKEKFVSSIDTIGSGFSATATQEDISYTQQLLENQNFLDEYKATIADMRDASQRDLASIQNTIALRLSATGQFTKEEIEATINALQIEAERTDVKLDFASIDITTKDPSNFKKFVSGLTADIETAMETPDTTKSKNTIIGRSEQLNQAILSLRDAFKTSQIDQETYSAKMEIIRQQISGLSNPLATTTQMFTNFKKTLASGTDENKLFAAELEKNNIEGFANQILFMELAAAGAIGDVAELTKVIQAMNIITQNTAPPNIIANAKAYIASQVEEMKGINETFDKLYGQNQGTGTEGTGAKSPFQTATEQLKNNISEINNASSAYSKLSKAGMSAADAFKIAKDPALATALATTKVGTKQWKQLVSLTEQYLALTKTNTLSDAIKNLTGENTRLGRLENVSKYLQQIGLNGEQIQSMLGDPDIAEGLLHATGEGAKGFKIINNLAQKTKENADLKFKILPLEDQFKERMQSVSEWFSNEENALELKFKISTKADQDIVRLAQQQIDTLNFQMDDFEAGLTRLEDGEEAINQKYDNRIEALDKIIAANDRIADQNKEELNIFQMVARGDISGAAAGIAQLQQQKVKNALDARREALESQRKNELESLTAEVMVNGQKVMLTRSGIEENIKNIKQQIFNIEEKTIEPAQRRIDIAMAEKDNSIASLTVLGRTRDEWLNIENNIGLAKTRTTEYIAKLQEALDIAKKIPGALSGADASGQADIVKPEDFDPNKKPVVAPKPKPGSGQKPTPGGGKPADSALNRNIPFLTDRSKNVPYNEFHLGNFGLPSVKPGQAASSYFVPKNQSRIDTSKFFAPKNVGVGNNFGNSLYVQNRAMGGMVLPAPEPPPKMLAMGGMVMPRMFAAGGYAMGTDTVPAMLTPGEFVVSRYGVQNYGVDNLKAINNGTAAANSVYNGYNINVNVKSNSNPDQIANAVMAQIRQVNAQQVRGNRF